LTVLVLSSASVSTAAPDPIADVESAVNPPRNTTSDVRGNQFSNRVASSAGIKSSAVESFHPPIGGGTATVVATACFAAFGINGCSIMSVASWL
jgi:hypothetical protein